MPRYFHGSDYSALDMSALNPSSRRIDLCLTTSESIARQYATRQGEGFVHTFFACGLKIASQEQALELLGYDELDRMCMRRDTSALFHAFDECDARLILEAGFDGVEYLDCLPGTAETFECVRLFVLDADKIELECSEAA